MMYYSDYDDTDSTFFISYYGSDYYSALTEHSHFLTNSEGMIYIHSKSAWTSAPLPRDTVNWILFSKSGLLQYKTLYDLTVKRVINWCPPSLSLLYPILTAGIFFVFSFLGCFYCCSNRNETTSGDEYPDQKSATVKSKIKTKNRDCG